MLVVEHCEKEVIGVELQKVLVQLCALIPQQCMQQLSPHPIVDRWSVESHPIVQDTDIKEGPYVDADRANEDWNEVKDYILRVRRNYRKSSDLVQYLLTNDTFRQRFPDAHRIFAFGASIPAVSTACETGFSSASDMKTDKQANLEIHYMHTHMQT